MPYTKSEAQDDDNPLTGLYAATICTNGTCVEATVELHQAILPQNQTENVNPVLTSKDASWILTSAVIIFTMQTGFGLLEAGCVNPKSEINIMMKNALDVVFGGVTYWAFGFGLSFGDSKGSGSFMGVGYFFVHVEEESIGFIFALFLFQLSFSTTSTTIVSGALAERTKLLAYNAFSMLNTIVYSIPAHWIWSERGFLAKLGALDIAGCGPVHLVGGLTGLVATILIGPRIGAFDGPKKPPPSPVKAILGMFMLWWGWLRFNSGSVFIVSTNSQWTLAVTAAVNTIIASIGGGIAGVITSYAVGKIQNGPRYDVGMIVTGVLASLVSVTAICTMCQPWEAFLIGCIGVILAVITDHVVYKLEIDDPVGVVPVHAVCSIWGLLAVGVFAPEGHSSVEDAGGLIHTGSFYLLGIQAFTCVVIAGWTIICAFIELKLIDMTIGLRLPEEEEIKGADLVEHGRTVLAVSDSETSLLKQLGLNVEDVENQQPSLNPQLASHISNAFKDFIHSCERNELTMTYTRTCPDKVTFELSVKDRQQADDINFPIHM